MGARETTTEIVRRAQEHATAVGAPAPILSDDEIRRMFRVAEALARSGVYKDVGGAEQAFAKMLVGRSLGLGEAQSMQAIQFVKGAVQVHYSTLGMFVRAHGYTFRAPTLTNEEVVIEFYDARGELVGVSSFSQADAAIAGLNRPSRDGHPSNYTKFPRNMLFARAMSNGVRWFVPEATAGIPVYVEGEVPPAAELTSGSGDGGEQGLDLGPRVDAVVERARRVGHAGLANRGAVEIALGRRSPSVVSKWVSDASAELDRFEAARKDEVSDAEVVADDEEGGSPAAPAEVNRPDPRDVDVVDHRRRLEELRRRDLEAEEPDSDREAEIAKLEADLRAAGAVVPGQEGLFDA